MFDVDYEKAQVMASQYNTYFMSVNNAAGSLNVSLQSYMSMDSFKGKAADNAKAYVGEALLGLSSMYIIMVEQLKFAYGEYIALYKGGAVSETSSTARWHENSMKESNRNLRSIDKDCVSSIVFELDKAAACVASLALDAPNAAKVASTSMSDLLADAVSGTEKVISGVRENEAKGIELLSSGMYRDAFNGFQSMLAIYSGSKGCKSYVPGSFGSAASELGLDIVFSKCLDYQDEHRDSIDESLAECTQTEKAMVARQKEEAEKSRNIWATIGTIGSVLVTIGAACALVAAAGAASPILLAGGLLAGGIGLVSATSDMNKRLGDLKEKKNGTYDSKAEKDDTSKKLLKGSKKTVKFVSNYADAKVGFDDRDLKRYQTSGKKAGHEFGDAVADHYIDQFKEKNEEAGTVVDFTKEVGEGIYDIYDNAKNNSGHWFESTEGAKTMLGKSGHVGLANDLKTVGNAGAAIGAAGKATEIVADYYEEKAQEEVDRCDDRLDVLNRQPTSATGNITWDPRKAAFA